MKTTEIESPGTAGSLTRRSFLFNASAAAGALVIGVHLPLVSRAAEVVAESAGTALNAYVSIGSDDSITISYGGSELGQGTMSGLPQILAEELKVDWDAIRIVQADYSVGGISYFTAGSGAVRRQHDRLRDAGAAAREMLVTAGAAAMGVDVSQCRAEAGRVYGPSSSRSYGELAAAAAVLPVPVSPAWTDRSQFQSIGKRLPRVDIPLKVNGRAVYGIDVQLPGMVFASVRHCPTFGGTLRSMPRTPSGALAVVALEAPESRGATKAGDVNAVAVVTDSNTWKAMRAARRLRVSWNTPAYASEMDDVFIRTRAEELMESGEAHLAEAEVGDVEGGLASAERNIDSTYYLPYVPHVCMEVLNCTVDYREDSCEIWCPVQAASWVHSEAVKLTGLAPEAVTVHTTFLGGGLGRKIERDYYSQAIQVARAIRLPVKVTWTREEDTRFDQYRPMALINVKAGIDADGAISAWHYRHVSPSISRQRGRSLGRADGQATEGQTRLPYAFQASRSEWVEHPSPIPVGYWRSVGHSLNAFAVECAVDELAETAGLDPMEFRKRLMKEHPRALDVLERADAESQWRHSLRSGRAWGIAFAEAFGSLVCQVVEVSGSTSSLRVHRVTCVVDCGTAINPGSVEMQMQSGIIHGLNAALWGGQRFEEGRPRIANFNAIRMLRVKEAPDVDVHIIDSGEPPGGIGEPGVPPIAPAVANAYYRLVGVRVRELPFFTG